MTDSNRPARPDPLTLRPDTVPEKLREREQWVCWRYSWDADRDEWTKVPVDVRTGGYASSTDADTWASFSRAVAYHDREGHDTDGVGFVVHDGDLVVGLDLDDCRDPDTGACEPWADDVTDTVPTYAEVSPSGTGLRLFGFGFLPNGGNRADVENAAGHLELYDSGRYLTVTGHHVDGTPDEIRQVNDEIRDVHAEYIADDPEPSDVAGNGGMEGVSPNSNPGKNAPKVASVDDADLIERAKAAENGEKFARLWNGDTSGYPSPSEADMALASLLAWWTGGDRQRTDRLFRDSGLMREKWDADRGDRTYGERTVSTALGSVGTGYDPAASTDGGTVAVPPPEELIAQIDAGERSYPATDDADGDADHADPGPPGGSWCSPTALVTLAGLDVDEGDNPADAIGDLNDRERAAYVWQLVKRSEDVHVRVRRDNGGLWAYDPETGVWDSDGERALRHAAVRTLATVNYGQNVLAELKAQVRSDIEAEVDADTFGVAPGRVAVANGLLDLDAAADGAGADALRDLTPEDYALARLPVAYNPDATAGEWAALVEEWTEDGKAAALQEYIGYCLHVGALPIHRALLLVGTGANGKGTFLSVVRALLGRENTTSIELQTLANERDAVADFYGSIANIDDDLSARKLGQGLGMFKKLVAGDRVRARKLYEDGFEFDATGKHLYAANEVPDVSSDVGENDDAFWRRWLLVEFPNHYPPSERDPMLRDRLTEPERLSGVLNWAIAGRRRLLENGHFTNEARHAQGKRERWQAWGESVDKFIAECVEHDTDAPRLSTQDAHRRYAAWCREHNEDPVGQRQLTNKLKNEDVEYGRHRIDGKSQRGYKALGLSDAVPDVDDTPDRDADPDDALQDTLG